MIRPNGLSELLLDGAIILVLILSARFVPCVPVRLLVALVYLAHVVINPLESKFYFFALPTIFRPLTYCLN